MEKTVVIHEETTTHPISLMGEMAGVCWDAELSPEANLKRGNDCIDAEHGRVLEYPQVYVIIDGFSARMIRELYTHIAGGPTRLQASTRRIDYESGFEFVTPPSIKAHGGEVIYEGIMTSILKGMQELDALGCPREDIALALPLGMTSKIVLRTNLRNLVDMSHQRFCSKAYWEYREFMNMLKKALYDYGDQHRKDVGVNEWACVTNRLFVPKCEYLGRCPEKKSCGRFTEQQS